MLRTFDHFMKLVVHVRASVFEWSESDFSQYKSILENSKKAVQTRLKQINMHWDFPDSSGGTSTRGPLVRSILHNEAVRNYILNDPAINNQHRVILKDYGQRLSVIIRIVNSKRLIKVDKFKEFCKNTYSFLLKSFPEQYNGARETDDDLKTWISITPSLHKLLAHYWELIENNDDHGLGSLDESGLEANNKILRNIRIKLSRKTSQTANVTDTLNRLWVGSDPAIHQERMKARPYCKACKVSGHGTRYCSVKRSMDEEGIRNDDELLKIFFQ